MKVFGLQVLHPLSKRQWKAGGLLFAAVFLSFIAAKLLFTAPAIVNLAAGIALAALFLEGIALWPFVYLAALLSMFANGSPALQLLLLPFAYALQAVLGAYVLKKADIDPLFRRLRDMFWFMGVAIASSLIVPTIGFASRALHELAFGTDLPNITWASWYTATLVSVFILSPFLIRWLAKRRFTRTGLHIFEILTSLGFLGLIGFFLFWTKEPTVAGISLTYLLLVPLFWIALRLRPRFLTLGFVMLSGIAITGLFYGIHGTPAEALGERLIQTEVFLIVLAAIFYVLVSLEEERRVTAQLMQSQVASLENAITRMSHQDRAKTEFIAMLAHELRNPLAPVMSTIEFLKLKGSDDPEKLEAFSMMENRMHTVRRLLDDLLDVSRITENKLSMEKETVDLRTVFSRAVLSSESHFKERRQSISTDAPSQPVYVEADPVRLEQIFTNLLTNASKFSGSRDHIQVRVQEKDGRAEVSVTDRGVGIAPEMQAHIFKPFLQVELGERTRKGLGIGLALVKSLVEMHNGNVWVRSEGKDRGSTFTISLPLAPAEKIAAMRRSPTAVPESAMVSHAERANILVVDDNDAAAAAIGKLLTLSGYTVDYAYDGSQAVEKARQEPFDAIFLDIGLPDKNGVDVAREIKANGFTGKILALTGYSLEEERQKAMQAGFDEYLVKPVGLAEMRRALRK